MTKPKILYIHANNQEIGGADYCLFKMALEMHKLDWPCMVVLRTKNAIYELYKNNGIPVVLLPIVRLQKSKNPLVLFSYFFSIPNTILIVYRLILSEKIGLVHTNDLLDFSGNIAAWLAGVSSCHHIRMIVLHPYLLIKILRWLCVRFSTKIICVSKSARAHLLKKHDYIKTEIIYDWIDMDATGQVNNNLNLKKELGIPKNAIIIGCIGRLEYWKGQHVFLFAANKLLTSQKNPAHFLVVGGTTTRKEGYLDDLKIIQGHSDSPGNIHFLGWRSDATDIMRQLDVMVHSSIEPEPFGLVVMEAMFAGAMVVAANAGGVPEQIEQNVNGFLYEPGNVNDMVEKILLALQTKEREAIKQRARETVINKFDKKSNLQKLLNIYTEISVHE